MLRIKQIRGFTDEEWENLSRIIVLYYHTEKKSQQYILVGEQPFSIHRNDDAVKFPYEQRFERYESHISFVQALGGLVAPGIYGTNHSPILDLFTIFSFIGVQHILVPGRLLYEDRNKVHTLTDEDNRDKFISALIEKLT